MKQKSNSGQILIISIFIVALLLLSSELYIFDVCKITHETELNSLEDFILAIKLGSKHVAVGSLINASRGGPLSSLSSNLQAWSSFIGKQYQFGKSSLDYTLRDTSPYSSGIWIYQGTDGYGIASAYVSFNYKLSGRETTINQDYFINITSAVIIQSTFQVVGGNDKRVNVTISVLNEMEPALAKQITISYERSGVWLIPDETNSYAISDYGTGTYVASFVADIPASSVAVSAQVVDTRGILVQANATSVET